MRRSLLWLWAVRDLLRRPGEGALAGASLASFIWVVGTALLLESAVQQTSQRLIEAGPSAVVRRLGPGGLAPIPLAATASVAKVPGVLQARARLWGPARVAGQPVEVVGLDAEVAAMLTRSGFAHPNEDRVIAGPGFARKRRAYVVVVGPGGQATLQIDDVLPMETGLVAQDTIVVTAETARRILDLPGGHATDIVFDVNLASEEDAIRPDVQDILPFPVVISVKHEALGRNSVSLGHRSGVFLMLMIPAGFALLLLVLAVARDRAGRAREVGILKAVGWTSRDILALHGLRAVWIALPAVTMGSGLAWGSVFGPWVRWPGALLFGWPTAPPALFLDAGGAGLVLAQVTTTVLVPWFVASLWPAIRSSARDPWDLIGEGEG